MFTETTKPKQKGSARMGAYKKAILKMVKELKDENVIKKVYTFTKYMIKINIAKKEKGSKH